MFKRGLILFSGLILSYFAILAGDGMHQYILNMETGIEIEVSVIFILFALAAFAFGGFVWTMIVIENIIGEENGDDIAITMMNSASIICLSLVYGIIVSPFTVFGPAPWQWWSAWDLFLLLALFPTLYLAFEISSEAITSWRTRSKTKHTE